MSPLNRASCWREARREVASSSGARTGTPSFARCLPLRGRRTRTGAGGRGGEGGGGRASALASGDVRGASRGSGSSEAVAARARTRRPARSAEGAPGRGEEEDASSGMFERVHPAVDAARRAARRGRGATAALHQHRGGAACAMPRSAPSPGADHFCPPKGGHSTRWGEWVPPTALDSRNRRRNLQLGDARQSQTGGRPVLAWTRERFRESRVESGVSKLARGRRYPNTRGRDARVTFAGIMADTPYVSEFRRRTLRLPRARVLDARRRWRNRESSTAPAPGPSADAQFQRPKVASSTHPPPR